MPGDKGQAVYDSERATHARGGEIGRPCLRRKGGGGVERVGPAVVSSTITFSPVHALKMNLSSCVYCNFHYIITSVDTHRKVGEPTNERTGGRARWMDDSPFAPLMACRRNCPALHLARPPAREEAQQTLESRYKPRIHHVTTPPPPPRLFSFRVIPHQKLTTFPHLQAAASRSFTPDDR